MFSVSLLDPGSFTVKYDEGTGIYTIEGVLILQPNVSYPSVNPASIQSISRLPVRYYRYHLLILTSNCQIGI